MTQRSTTGAYIALILLNFVTGFGWIAYHSYQPALLDLFELRNLDSFLYYAQWIILSIVPMIAGRMSDWLNITKGKTKYMFIFVIGISVAALTFMSVAFSVGFSEWPEIKPLVPIFVVVWLISMNLFMAPANALFKNFAESKELPKLMVLLMLGLEGVYALEPIIIPLINDLGPVGTFISGGVLVSFIGYYFLRKINQNSKLIVSPNSKNKKMNYGLLLLVAIGFGSIFGFFIGWVPEMNIKMISISGSYYAAIILGLTTVLAWPASWLTRYLSIRQIFTFGFLIFILSIPGFIWELNTIVFFVSSASLVVGASMVSVSAFPLLLKSAGSKYPAFSVGVFLGASEAFEGLFGWVSSW